MKIDRINPGFFLSETELYLPNISENQLHSSKNPTLAGERVKTPTDVKSFWVALHICLAVGPVPLIHPVVQAIHQAGGSNMSISTKKRDIFF